MDDEIDLIALLRTLWRGMYLIGFFAVLGLVLGVVYLTNLAVPTYQSTAVVALNDKPSQVVDIESVVSGFGGDQSAVNTETEVLRSRNLMEKVVEKLDLMSSPEFNPSLAEEPFISLDGIASTVTGLLTGQPTENNPLTEEEQRIFVIRNLNEAISVDNIRQSFVFRITATTTDPQLSKILANSVAELYLESQLEDKFEATERATTWLTARVAELQIELENAEQAVKNFSVQTDLISPEALQNLEVQIKDLRNRVLEADVSLRAQTPQLEALKAARDIQALRALSNDPQLRSVPIGDSSRFEAVKKSLVNRSQTLLDRAQSKKLGLQASLEQLEADTSEQAQDLVALRQLQREAEASKLIYEFFLARLKETAVQKGIQEADARILSFAQLPLKKSSPQTSLVLVMSILIGLIGGAGLVLVRELTTSTFRTSEDMESELGYQVIGQVPLIPISHRNKIIDYIVNKSTSAAVEAIRNIRTTLLLKDLDNPPKIIVSTSTVASEGKTTQSIGLAINLAGMGNRVLLIEGDIRRRVFGEYFSCPGLKGLVSVLIGSAELKDVVFHDDRTGIDVLQGEKTTANAADLYSSKRFTDFMRDLRAEYDVIIIDTPPTLLVPDARIIAQNADAVIYTVKWDATPKAQVKRGLRLFESVGINVDGLVLSQVNSKGMKAYGYADYGDAGYYDN